jgi:hypothetical protein
MALIFFYFIFFIQNDCKHIVTKLPEEGSNELKFKNVGRQLPVPFVVYADSETNLKPIDSCSPERKKYFFLGGRCGILCTHFAPSNMRTRSNQNVESAFKSESRI